MIATVSLISIADNEGRSKENWP